MEKLNYRNRTHEIKCDEEYTEILISVFKEYNINYSIIENVNKYYLINIAGIDIDKVYDALGDEMFNNKKYITNGNLNDYPIKIDNLLGIFTEIIHKSDF